MTALDTRARLRLVTISSRQIKFVADSRTKTLRVVDALRATIVALSVVREDGRDRVEWTGAEAIVSSREEIEHLRIEAVEKVADAAVELIVTAQTELCSAQIFKLKERPRRKPCIETSRSRCIDRMQCPAACRRETSTRYRTNG